MQLCKKTFQEMHFYYLSQKQVIVPPVSAVDVFCISTVTVKLELTAAESSLTMYTSSGGESSFSLNRYSNFSKPIFNTGGRRKYTNH